MEQANDRQIGGSHYKKHGETGEQLWDRIVRLKLDFFQGTIIKYIERWKEKNGLEDLLKAQHYLQPTALSQKYIEVTKEDLDKQCPL